MKEKADGKCNECNGPVPEGALNKFYCSEACRREGFIRYHGKHAFGSVFNTGFCDGCGRQAYDQIHDYHE